MHKRQLVRTCASWQQNGFPVLSHSWVFSRKENKTQPKCAPFHQFPPTRFYLDYSSPNNLNLIFKFFIAILKWRNLHCLPSRTKITFFSSFSSESSSLFWIIWLIESWDLWVSSSPTILVLLKSFCWNTSTQCNIVQWFVHQKNGDFTFLRWATWLSTALPLLIPLLSTALLVYWWMRPLHCRQGGTTFTFWSFIKQVYPLW